MYKKDAKEKCSEEKSRRYFKKYMHYNWFEHCLLNRSYIVSIKQTNVQFIVQ